jgi:hypothetical protein
MTWWDEPVTLYLDNLRTINELNVSRQEHWATKHKRAKLQRSTTFHGLRHLLPARPPPLPLKITVTRIAPSGGLDSHDGLAASVKHIIDGISDYLAGAYGAGQDQQPGLVWAYRQRRGKPREYAVEIRLEALAQAECDLITPRMAGKD